MLVQEYLCLGNVEPEVGNGNLEQFSACTKPGDRQRWLHPGGEHELETAKRVVQKDSDRLVHIRARDQVEVLDHQHGRFLQGVQFVDQDWRARRRRDSRQGARRMASDCSPIAGAKARSASITYKKKRLGSLSPRSKASQAKRRDSCCGHRPGRQETRLAPAGRRTDEGETAGWPGAQAVERTQAWYEVPRHRRMHLGSDRKRVGRRRLWHRFTLSQALSHRGSFDGVI